MPKRRVVSKAGSQPVAAEGPSPRSLVLNLSNLLQLKLVLPTQIPLKMA